MSSAIRKARLTQWRKCARWMFSSLLRLQALLLPNVLMKRWKLALYSSKRQIRLANLMDDKSISATCCSVLGHLYSLLGYVEREKKNSTLHPGISIRTYARCETEPSILILSAQSFTWLTAWPLRMLHVPFSINPDILRVPHADDLFNVQ